MTMVDILLPVRNGLEFFRESLDSVKSQTFEDWRCIILDHGSTDGSLELAQRYHQEDARFEVHSFPDADGLADLLNRGLALAEAPFIMRLDADDIALPERIARSLAAFDRFPGMAVVGGQATVIDRNGRKIGRMTVPTDPASITISALFANPIIHPAVMLRKSELDLLNARYGVEFIDAGDGEPFVVNSLAEDYLMFGQFAILGKCINLADDLILYRQHGSNVGKARFDDQVAKALEVSRHLVRKWCRQNALPYFDPLPFCTHGGTLMKVAGRTGFTAEARSIQAMIKSVVAPNADLGRELQYLSVIRDRKPIRLLLRYLRFSTAFPYQSRQWYPIKAWLRQWVKNKLGRGQASAVA